MLGLPKAFVRHGSRGWEGARAEAGKEQWRRYLVARVDQ